jgi:spore coat protein CotH
MASACRNKEKMMIIKRLTALALALSALFTLCACKKNKAEGDKNPAYGGLFDTSYVHSINVEIAEDDLSDLYANPLAKTKYAVSVTIDGNRVENVSFSTKGNTSLMSVAATDSKRFSFKLNFGKYEKGQTYFGLDKLNLNNIYSDATFMKDYLSYMIMREAGVKAPLISYAELSINGELHGLYIAIENVSESFIERNYGSDEGALFKPGTDRVDNISQGGERPEDRPGGFGGDMPMPSGMPGGFGGDGAIPTFDPNMPMPSDMPGGFGGDMPMPSFDPNMPMPSDMPGGFGGGMPGGFGDEDTGGADLVYTDDDPASYPAIFDNEETDVTDEERTRLIEAIKALSTDENTGEYWDMDQVIRYFAAHNFVLNYDSYTGNMLHNYYLLERDGKTSVIPWDYNLAFGGFSGAGDAEKAVNTPIESPLSGASEESRPLWNAIVSNEEYLKAYEECYDQLLSAFFESGSCASEIARVKKMIASCVKNDPSAFYTYKEFEAAVSALTLFCEKRAESIRRQLSGRLGKTSGTQNEADMVSADGLDMSKMGTMGMGGDPGQAGQPPQGGFPGQSGPPPQGGFPGQSGNPPQGGFPGQSGNPPQGGFPGQGGTPPGQ